MSALPTGTAVAGSEAAAGGRHEPPPVPVAVLLAVAVVVAAWTAVGIPARATYGARTSADEPQYLLTALSLAEDRSLDIGDELAEERWRAFHRAGLPVQTAPRPDGQELSPHDPLLPLLLAVPMAVGGWAAAKATLAVLAGVLAALLVWVAVRRFRVPPAAAVGTVAAFALAAPLTAYGVQVYPELPAALATTLAIAALTGPMAGRGRWTLALAVVALPWLAVKYVPVAAALAGVGVVGLWRTGRRRPAAVLVAGLAVAGAVFLAFHRAVYGGWTVYSSGDHFTGGEFTVVGESPDYVGRSVRLLGLLLDQGFGLAAWAPVFLLAVPALAALARGRPPGWVALAAPLAAGWLNATFVALTMHGWWWPGRQVVVVVPAMVLATAWWVGRVHRAVPVVAVLAAAGVLAWGWLMVDVLSGRRRLIIDFGASGNPVLQAWKWVLPDYRTPSLSTWLLQGGWMVIGLAGAWFGWRSVAPPTDSGRIDHAPTAPTQEEPPHVHS